MSCRSKRDFSVHLDVKAKAMETLLVLMYARRLPAASANNSLIERLPRIGMRWGTNYMRWEHAWHVLKAILPAFSIGVTDSQRSRPCSRETSKSFVSEYRPWCPLKWKRPSSACKSCRSHRSPCDSSWSGWLKTARTCGYERWHPEKKGSIALGQHVSTNSQTWRWRYWN